MFATGNVHEVPFRIVGTVADIQQAPIGQPAEPAIYYSHRQFPFRAMTVVARGQDTATVVSGIRQALHRVDRALALGDVRTMNDRLMMATAAPRLLTAVLTTFAVLTGLLAAIGVYGLLAWTVNEQRRELANRLALGAQPVVVARLVTQQGLFLAGGGVLLGLGVAQLAGRLLRQVLFETRTTDVVAMTGAAALLLTAALVAASLRRFAPLELRRRKGCARGHSPGVSNQLSAISSQLSVPVPVASREPRTPNPEPLIPSRPSVASQSNALDPLDHTALVEHPLGSALPVLHPMRRALERDHLVLDAELGQVAARTPGPVPTAVLRCR